MIEKLGYLFKLEMKNMEIYENHKDRRYRELNERRRKFIGKNKHIKNVKIKLV